MLPILELLDPRIWLWILHWDVGRVRDAPHHQNSQVRFFGLVGVSHPHDWLELVWLQNSQINCLLPIINFQKNQTDCQGWKIIFNLQFLLADTSFWASHCRSHGDGGPFSIPNDFFSKQVGESLPCQVLLLRGCLKTSLLSKMVITLLSLLWSMMMICRCHSD